MKKAIIAITVVLILGCTLIFALAAPRITSLFSGRTGIVGTDKFIGEEAARAIALEKAGVSAENVRFEWTELERDDGAWRYEIDFFADGVEYTAEINAENGTVLKWETEKR